MYVLQHRNNVLKKRNNVLCDTDSFNIWCLLAYDMENFKKVYSTYLRNKYVYNLILWQGSIYFYQMKHIFVLFKIFQIIILVCSIY